MSGRSKRVNSAGAVHVAGGASGFAAVSDPATAGIAGAAAPVAAIGIAGHCCAAAVSLCNAKNCAATMAAAAAVGASKANLACLLEDINASFAFSRRQDVQHR